MPFSSSKEARSARMVIAGRASAAKQKALGYPVLIANNIRSLKSLGCQVIAFTKSGIHPETPLDDELLSELLKHRKLT